MSIAIAVDILANICNPFVGQPWPGHVVTMENVSRALKERYLISEPTDTDHAARIAYLVENEATDPIEIDVGVPSMGCHVAWPIEDGNHRFAAAIYAGRSHVNCNVAGSLEYAMELFGVDCSDETPSVHSIPGKGTNLLVGISDKSRRRARP